MRKPRMTVAALEKRVSCHDVTLRSDNTRLAALETSKKSLDECVCDIATRLGKLEDTSGTHLTTLENDVAAARQFQTADRNWWERCYHSLKNLIDAINDRMSVLASRIEKCEKREDAFDSHVRLDDSIAQRVAALEKASATQTQKPPAVVHCLCREPHGPWRAWCGDPNLGVTGLLGAGPLKLASTDLRHGEFVAIASASITFGVPDPVGKVTPDASVRMTSETKETP